MNPIGARFGVVGTYIESRRAAGAQQEMQAVLAKASYNYEAALSESVFVAMSKAGFAMVHSPESRPEKERSRFMEHYPSTVKRVDAFLDVYADYVGFQAMRSSEEYWPHLEISARLVDARSGKILYQGRIVYGFSVATDEDAVLVHAENTFRFRDRTALQANQASVTARALQGGEELTRCRGSWRSSLCRQRRGLTQCRVAGSNGDCPLSTRGRVLRGASDHAGDS